VIATSSNSIQENAPAVAVHAVKVAVDTETGKVSPINYIAVQDVGFAINPMLIEGTGTRWRAARTWLGALGRNALRCPRPVVGFELSGLCYAAGG
jgi:hypothetical protein